jgi:uncharacterized protein YecT (DUF1311 family)
MPPYEGEVGYCAKDRFNDWYKKLKRLIVDGEFRQALQEEQRAWVLANRDIQQQGHKWEQVYLGEDTHFDK